MSHARLNGSIEIEGVELPPAAELPVAADQPADPPTATLGRPRKARHAAEGSAAPTRGRSRKARPERIAPAETPTNAVLPPAAPFEAELLVRQAGQALPLDTSFWGAQPSNSLYEAEIEVRSQAERHGGQAAAMGDLAAGLLKLISENLRRMSEPQVERVNELLRGIDLRDYLDPDFWKGLGMIVQYQLDEQRAFVQRRLRGEYHTDPYGMDREMIEAVRPFLAFMYRSWWRVDVDGLAHVPGAGRALLVSNHSGVLPWDGAMIGSAVIEDHPDKSERVMRSLHLHWFSTLPFIAPALAAMGQVPGLPANAVRLLEQDELVCVFPEGLKGVGKLYKDRYKLARFGRGGFVQAALRTQAPIVPVAVVGAEEIYPMLANLEPLAKLLGFPYFPLTPFFPWLGLLGVIPLPTRWSISFCPPISTSGYGPEAADDPLVVLALAEQVRDTIQATIDAKLAERKSIF